MNLFSRGHWCNAFTFINTCRLIHHICNYPVQDKDPLGKPKFKCTYVLYSSSIRNIYSWVPKYYYLNIPTYTTDPIHFTIKIP